MSNKYRLLLGIFLVTLPLLLFSSHFSNRIFPTEVYGQFGLNCANIQLNTPTKENIFSKTSNVPISLSNVLPQSETDILLKIISGLQSEAAYALPVELIDPGSSRTTSINVSEMLQDIPPSDFDLIFIVYTKVYDESGNLKCNGDPSISPNDPTFCPGCIKLLSITSDPRLLNLSSDTLGIAKAQVDNTPTPTASPTPTPVAYFRFQDEREPQTFIFKLENNLQIQQVRDMLSGVTEPLHVAGILRKWQEDYNRPWDFHIDESNVVFVTSAPDSCDATISTIQNYFDTGTANLLCTPDFLPNCVWCPHQSTIIEEVDDPFSNQCSNELNGDANGDGKATPNDFSVWAYYFHPFNQIEGFESVGDFNCDGFVNANDFSIWSFHFTPF